MKRILAISLLFCIFSTGCKKDTIIVPVASFSFRGDTSSVLKMATYDTCTLFNNSTNSDSVFWDLGNGNVSKMSKLTLTYSKSGVYTIRLTAKNINGKVSSTTKTVIVLDRVLKKIILKTVFWDTIPNHIPNFNAVWPTSSRADIYVLVQKFAWADSIVPYSGVMPNSPILYQSQIIPNVSSHTTVPVVINVPGKVIVDKKMVMDKSFVISLMAKDTKNVIYALQSSLESGSSFGIQQESLVDNKFIVVCNLFCGVEFHCDFE